MKKIILLLFLFIPNISFAEIVINEIMYDPEGTDTGREWIEIYNTGPESIDLLQTTLFENEVNHKISLINGSNILDQDQYAIIADNADKFFIDYPDLSTNVFDSAFSLNNTGETLSLNLNGSSVTSATYNSDLGAKGNGGSLQLYGGIFIESLPTPGTINSTIPIVDTDNTDKTDNAGNVDTNVSAHSSQILLTTYEHKDKIEVGAGRERLVTINTPISFDAVMDSKVSKKRVKFIWTLGDGNSRTGENIKYLYKYPGVYNLVLNVYTKDEHAVSRTVVKVIEPIISSSIYKIKDELVFEVHNKSEDEINIGNFIIKNGESSFVFPEDTILSSDQKLILNYLDMEIEEYNSDVRFLYPNEKAITLSVDNSE